MAGRVRNAEWQDDMDLKSDLKKYVQQNLVQNEILDFMNLKYPMYAWSLRTLSRRLNYFGITFTDYGIGVEEVRRAVEIEMSGPGSLLGYRALHKKIREVHGLNVPRNLVYDMMHEVNPQGLQERGSVGEPTKRPRRTNAFTSNGPDWTISLDGHDKLCGYQNSMFPLCIYGAQDTYSSRINFLKIWTSNSNPKVIGRFYLEYLFESGGNLFSAKALFIIENNGITH